MSSTNAAVLRKVIDRLRRGASIEFGLSEYVTDAERNHDTLFVCGALTAFLPPVDDDSQLRLRTMAESLIEDLNTIAREYDHYEYGLPRHGDEVQQQMIDAVLARFKELKGPNPS